MCASQDSTGSIATLLEQKIEEAELDLTDVQVSAVIMALCDVLSRHAEMAVQLLERARRVKRGKLSMKRFEAWVKEHDDTYDSKQHFRRLLLEAAVDLDDEAVRATMAVAIDVWTHAGNVFDSVFDIETLEQQSDGDAPARDLPPT
jgi:hypothetical protein